jgi:hypothetical protein
LHLLLIGKLLSFPVQICNPRSHSNNPHFELLFVNEASSVTVDQTI